MRYAQIRDMDISNGSGIGVALFTQGCRFHCKNCFNQELWDYDGGQQWDENSKNELLRLASKSHITRLSILGGEPLSKENIEDLSVLFSDFKSQFPNKQIWLYSGYTFENISKDILENVDVLVDGQYIDELKDYKLKFRGSSNQRIIDVQKSLQDNEVVIKEV